MFSLSICRKRRHKEKLLLEVGNNSGGSLSLGNDQVLHVPPIAEDDARGSGDQITEFPLIRSCMCYLIIH